MGLSKRLYSLIRGQKINSQHFVLLILFLLPSLLYQFGHRHDSSRQKKHTCGTVPKLDEVRPRLDIYPRGGTGETVDIEKHFDPTIFNEFCHTENALKAVLPVYSSVGNFETRYVLRGTLGQWAKQLNCKLFFIVGVSEENGVNALLKEEYVRERDLLVIDKIDTYRDLNNKAAAMIEWIRQYCMNVSFIIHLIDDAYINLGRFLERLDSIGNVESYILGAWADTPTVREYWLYRSYVSKEEYPYPRFPIYAYGFAYAFPSNTVEHLHRAMYNATYCWIEDVWIAGHVREMGGVKLVPLRPHEWTQSLKVAREATRLPESFIIHGVKGDLLKRVYSFAVQ